MILPFEIENQNNLSTKEFFEELLINEIIEKKGSFDKQYDVVEYITAKILSCNLMLSVNPKYDKYGFLKINLSSMLNWLREVELSFYIKFGVEDINCYGSTVPMREKDIIKDGKTRYVVSKMINLYLFVKNNLSEVEKEMKSLIAHELLHIYEDFNRRINTINKMSKKVNTISNVQDKVNYNNVFSLYNFYKEKNLNAISLFFYALYALTPFEINAYVSSVYQELKDNNTNIENFKENLKKTYAFSKYSEISNTLVNALLSIKEEYIPQLRKICTENNIKPFNVSDKLDDKAWLSKIIREIGDAANKALKSCARNASLYFEDLQNGMIEYNEI